MTEATENEPFDIRGLLRTLRQYAWLVLASVVVVGGSVTLWTMRQPPVYEAIGVVEYDPNPVRPLGGEVEDVADPIGSFWSSREYFETQNRIIASRSIAEQVVERLGLNNDPSFFGVAPEGFEPRTVTEAAQMVVARLTVEPVADTRLIELHVRDGDPERAQLLVNTVAATYIEKLMQDRMGSTVAALDWLSEQLDSLREELNASELALHQFKEDHSVLSLSMEDRQNLVAAEIGAFNQALTDARQQRIVLNARAARLRGADTSDPLTASAPALDRNEAVTSLRHDLRELLAERGRLSVRYGVNHPAMQSIGEQIRALTEQLRQEIELVVASATADLREATMIESGIRAALDEANASGLELNLREIEYQRLNRARENTSKLYDVVLERTTETDLTRMMRTTHVRVLDEALPGAKVSPNVPLNAVVGVLAGLFLGLLLVFALRFLDRRLKSPADVEELGISVLGILPTIGKKIPRAKKGKTLPPDGRDLVSHTHPMSAAAECCRSIRTNLVFMSPDSPIRSFVVTSPTPQEGKTTVACNLAISLAQSGKSVLLIDTDLRRPRIHKSFDVTMKEGVTTALVGRSSLAEATVDSGIAGLKILPCGPVPPNPSELLHGEGFTRLLSQALSQYDRVILDSPPLGAVTDAAVLAPQVDGVILVIKAERTTRDGLRYALRQLKDVSAKVLGAVVNDVDLERKPYGHDGYYQYYQYNSYSEANEAARTAAAREAAE